MCHVATLDAKNAFLDDRIYLCEQKKRAVVFNGEMIYSSMHDRTINQRQAGE